MKRVRRRRNRFYDGEECWSILEYVPYNDTLTINETFQNITFVNVYARTKETTLSLSLSDRHTRAHTHRRTQCNVSKLWRYLIYITWMSIKILCRLFIAYSLCILKMLINILKSFLILCLMSLLVCFPFDSVGVDFTASFCSSNKATYNIDVINHQFYVAGRMWSPLFSQHCIKSGVLCEQNSVVIALIRN